jgi:exodeoxyribonuclease VII large subunit
MANGNGIIDALFDDEENRPISVSELAAMIRGELERKFSSVWVEGEIVGFTVSGPGHWYFSLRDADAQIKAACFVNQNSRLRLRPFNGLHAIVRGKFSFYPQRGDAQLIVTSVEAAGEGAFKIEFERRKKLLESEGLFSPSLKRPIPKIPRRVGIVTSPTGAAFHDIVKVITRRTRSLDIVLLPAKVQGEGASEEIIRSIEIANSFNLSAQDVEKIDVLIVGRGGGSQEDLWAFNDEGLARAIRASSIPVISAVGHEIDTTISDMVADFRAATPSVAAAMVSAGEEDLARKIGESYRRIVGAMSYSLLGVRHRLEFLSASQSLSVEPLALRNGREKLGDLDDDLSRIIVEKLSDLSDRLDSAMRRMSPEKLAADLADKRGRFGVINHRMVNVIESAVAMKGQRLRTLSASLNALSPLRVLSRGYSLTKKADSLVVSVKQVKVGDVLDITVSDGRIKVKAEKIEEGIEDAR